MFHFFTPFYTLLMVIRLPSEHEAGWVLLTHLRSIFPITEKLVNRKCNENQLTGFYMIRTLALNGLLEIFCISINHRLEWYYLK